MEILRDKIEKLTERIDRAENISEEASCRMKDLVEQINENELYSEDIKRRYKCARKRIDEVNAKTLRAEEQAIIYEQKTEKNQEIIKRLELESNKKEEVHIRTEEMTNKAKMHHMALSGAYEDARSRKQLLLKEIEKVSTSSKVNLQQVNILLHDTV